MNSDFVNNSSVAYMVSLNGTNTVFLGDLALAGGNQLLSDVDLRALDCDIVQMAHHGQNGVGYEVYKALKPEICLWPTPQWLWDNDSGSGGGSGNWTAGDEELDGTPGRESQLLYQGRRPGDRVGTPGTDDGN